MRGKREEGEEGTNDRPFGAKTRWRILKNNTRLSLPLCLGPSAILHSRGGLPALPIPRRILLSPLSPPRRASFILGRDLGGPKNGRLKGKEGGREEEEAGIHSSPCPIRCDAMRSDAGERGCLVLSMCDNLNHAGRRRAADRPTDGRTADWHVEHRDNGAPTANGMVAKGGGKNNLISLSQRRSRSESCHHIRFLFRR